MPFILDQVHHAHSPFNSCAGSPTSPSKDRMPFKIGSLKSKLGSKKDSSVSTSPTGSRSLSFRRTPSNHTSDPRSSGAQNPFPTTTPTRRPRITHDEAPPAYFPPADSAVVSGRAQPAADSPYSFLTQFDTVFLIDDSGSMAGSNWRETSAALAAITPICTAHDADGIDIWFLNHRNPVTAATGGAYSNVTTSTAVDAIFNAIRPSGGTPTGTRLHHILKPYLRRVEQAMSTGQEVKPLNIIMITDGEAGDDPETVIVNAANKLDQCGAEPWQIGIQFFQVGKAQEAKADLERLDDDLSKEHDCRDMVDTVPWSGQDGYMLSPEGILKVVLGSVNKRLDRRRNSDERLRN